MGFARIGIYSDAARLRWVNYERHETHEKGRERKKGPKLKAQVSRLTLPVKEADCYGGEFHTLEPFALSLGF